VAGPGGTGPWHLCASLSEVGAGCSVQCFEKDTLEIAPEIRNLAAGLDEFKGA